MNKLISFLRYSGTVLLTLVLIIGLIILWALSMGTGLSNDDDGYQKFLQQERDKKGLESGMKAFQDLQNKYGDQ